MKACIFDLDGTLVNSVHSIAHSINHTLKGLGLREQPVDAFNFYAGDGLDLALKRAMEASGYTDEEGFRNAVPMTREYFAKHALYKVAPYQGITETLDRLKKQGIKIAVFSNKPHEAAVSVVHSLFGDVFDMVQGQSDEVPKKPNPTGALKIADAFHVDPDEVLYFGDTDTDMKTGLAAGMYTVGVTWGFRPREELLQNHAMALIDSPAEICVLIGNCNQ